MKISEELLEGLREKISGRMSGKRLAHTLAVEKMAVKIGELYCPEKTDILAAAALLHDITKEKTTEEHIAICEKYGTEYTNENVLAPKTFHAITAAALIPTEFSEFNDDEIISAVRYHTTGRADMTLAEKIIYIADYIDDTRTFPDCIALREMFFGVDLEKMSEEERYEHLDRVVLTSFEMTIEDLLENGRVVNTDTMAARDSLLKNRKTEK